MAKGAFTGPPGLAEAIAASMLDYATGRPQGQVVAGPDGRPTYVGGSPDNPIIRGSPSLGASPPPRPSIPPNLIFDDGTFLTQDRPFPGGIRKRPPGETPIQRLSLLGG
jgi:hypothetical protein